MPVPTIQERIAAAYRQTLLWALPATGWNLPAGQPGDRAAALASEHWAPVLGELQRCAPAGAATAYAQALAMLQRTYLELHACNRFAPAERLQIGSFLQTLIHHYTPLATA